MTIDDINGLLATLCGWKCMNCKELDCKGCWQVDEDYRMPNYCNNLDEVGYAERKILKTEQDKRLYVDYLVSLMEPGEFTVMADAFRRTKAILMLKGLWKE